MSQPTDKPAGKKRKLTDNQVANADEPKKKKVKVQPTIVRRQLPPMSLAIKPMDFQTETIAFAKARNGRIYLGDDMGLGKTLQAIATMIEYRQDWPLLIITPPVLKTQWKAEILKFVNGLIADDIVVVSKGSDPIGGWIDIVPYSLIGSKCEELSKKKYGCVIMDEGHYCKDHKSQRSKAAFKIVSQSKRRMILSGTPILNMPKDLFSPLRILGIDELLCESVKKYVSKKVAVGKEVTVDEKMFSNYRMFTTRYCGGRMDTKFNRWWDMGLTNGDELHHVIYDCCMIRRKKEDVLDQLPPKFRHATLIDISAKHKNAMNAIMKTARSQSKETVREMFRQGQLMMKLYSTNAESKVEPVAEYLKEIVSNSDEKFVIFGHHKAMLDGIEDMLQNHFHPEGTKGDVTWIRIDGDTKDDRHLLCTEFQTNPKCRYAVLSITAAGAGITLTAANHVIFAEIYWSPASLRQAEDRIYRIGQNRKCFITYIVGKDSYDQYLWKVIDKKLKASSQVIDGEAGTKMLDITKSIDVLADDNALEEAALEFLESMK